MLVVRGLWNWISSGIWQRISRRWLLFLMASTCYRNTQMMNTNRCSGNVARYWWNVGYAICLLMGIVLWGMWIWLGPDNLKPHCSKPNSPDPVKSSFPIATKILPQCPMAPMNLFLPQIARGTGLELLRLEKWVYATGFWGINVGGIGLWLIGLW